MNHVGTISLETKRLVLRRIYRDDAEEIYEGFVNQDEFLYYANKEKRTLEEQIKSLENIDEKYLNKEYYNWLIVEKESDNIIGSINLRVDNKNDSVEFNYAIDNRYTNKGYMTEALGIIQKFCLDELKVFRCFIMLLYSSSFGSITIKPLLKVCPLPKYPLMSQQSLAADMCGL